MHCFSSWCVFIRFKYLGFSFLEINKKNEYLINKTNTLCVFRDTFGNNMIKKVYQINMLCANAILLIFNPYSLFGTGKIRYKNLFTSVLIKP